MGKKCSVVWFRDSWRGRGGEGGYVSFSFSSGIVLDVLVLEKTALGEMIPADNASTITCQ